MAKRTSSPLVPFNTLSASMRWAGNPAVPAIASATLNVSPERAKKIASTFVNVFAPHVACVASKDPSAWVENVHSIRSPSTFKTSKPAPPSTKSIPLPTKKVLSTALPIRTSSVSFDPTMPPSTPSTTPIISLTFNYILHRFDTTEGIIAIC